MHGSLKQNASLLFSLLTLLSASICFTHVLSAKENPLTPKAFVSRYWNEQISNNLSIPSFLLSKASPLSIVHSAYFSKLASQHSLTSHLSSFCSSANLFCFLESPLKNNIHINADPSSHQNKEDANFAFYTNKDFAKYASSTFGGADIFKNYSTGINFATGSFTKYSRSSGGHREDFTSYADDGNIASSNFTSYAAAATGGSGDFKTYMPRVNVPDLGFSSYDSNGNGHKLSFSSYVDDTNSGKDGFSNYAKKGNGVPLDFTSYGDASNVIVSTFTSYGEMGNAANDSFKGYTSNANNPTNIFKNYGGGGNDGVDRFWSYRDAANGGSDAFQSYGRNSDGEKADFINYGNSLGSEAFKEYGEGSVGFKIYNLNNSTGSFKDYAKQDTTVTFGQYRTPTPSSSKEHASKFFREYMLKQGNVMKMPDIHDRLPKRSFLPRAISSKLPFSMNEFSNIKHLFNSTTIEHVIHNALIECERVASPGETKQCVDSMEGMIDFTVSILGRNVMVMTTQNVNGSRQEVMIGKVKGINGGKVTRSVSCHQSLYPYLIYYCHSVPKVRVYMADILDVHFKNKINNGVAICHLDTSAWSSSHAAFLALGSGPGIIEVCHWIFENDMTWTVSD